MSTATLLEDELNTEDSRASELASYPEVQTPASLDQEMIARVAYSYWEERQAQNVPGSAEEDWFRAISDLVAA